MKKLFCAVALLLSSLTFAQNNPVADPAAVVLAGNARLTVLTPQMIRMEWSANKQFEDHASMVFLNRKLRSQDSRKPQKADGWY